MIERNDTKYKKMDEILLILVKWKGTSSMRMMMQSRSKQSHWSGVKFTIIRCWYPVPSGTHQSHVESLMGLTSPVYIDPTW